MIAEELMKPLHVHEALIYTERKSLQSISQNKSMRASANGQKPPPRLS